MIDFTFLRIIRANTPAPSQIKSFPMIEIGIYSKNKMNIR